MDADVESSDDSPVNDAATECPTDNTFDPAVTTMHSYLGNNLEVVRGRTLLDNGIYVNLPIIFENSVILFPEQTLPMLEYSTRIMDMFRSCIEKDRTFGVARMGKEKELMIGTTAEIYEYSDNDQDGFCIKARGRQRFQILRTKRVQDQILAVVKILPEIVLGPPFFDERLASLDRLRKIPKNEDEAREQEYRVARRESIVTAWPSWVYRQYDARRIAMRIHKRLRFFESRGSNIPEDSVELSFWLAQNLFMNDTAKIALLQYNCAIPRLQYELKFLKMLGGKVFVCSTCRRLIGKYTDIVLMNKEGLQAAYCNPAGAIHETVTLYKATNVVLDQKPPSTVCSWFPGYAWTIGYCAGCRWHIGWYFNAVNDDLKPRAFWGLTRQNLILRRKYAGMKNDQTNTSSTSNVENPNEEERDDFSTESEYEDDDEPPSNNVYA